MATKAQADAAETKAPSGSLEHSPYGAAIVRLQRWKQSHLDHWLLQPLCPIVVVLSVPYSSKGSFCEVRTYLALTHQSARCLRLWFLGWPGTRREPLPVASCLIVSDAGLPSFIPFVSLNWSWHNAQGLCPPSPRPCQLILVRECRTAPFTPLLSIVHGSPALASTCSKSPALLPCLLF